MLVKINEKVFSDPGSLKGLRNLMCKMIEYEHVGCFDFDVTEYSDNFYDEVSEVMEQWFQASIIGDTMNPDCEVILDASKIHDDKKFSLTEANTYLRMPLEIYVENSDNDSPLVIKIMENYLSDGSSIQARYEQRHFIFGNGGGCSNIEHALSERLRMSHGRCKFLRCYVILDSDKKFKTQQVTKYSNLKRFLEDNNVPYHIWEKRCMENYLPLSAYPESGANRDWINAFKSLSEHQKDCINISCGFKGDVPQSKKSLIKEDLSNVRELLSDEQKDFFQDVSDANFNKLVVGYQVKYGVKDAWPICFQKGEVCKDSLDKITSHQDDSQELKKVAEEIYKLL